VLGLHICIYPSKATIPSAPCAVSQERDYKPSGWLGALMGTRLYFSLHDPRQIPSKIPALIRELGDAGRWVN
jgi:hypothetical protein